MRVGETGFVGVNVWCWKIGIGKVGVWFVVVARGPRPAGGGV